MTPERGQVHPHSWSPDGDKVAFAGLRKGFGIFTGTLCRTKQQKKLTFYTKPGHYVRYPSWSPKGDQVLFEFAQGTGVTWLMELK